MGMTLRSVAAEVETNSKDQLRNSTANERPAQRFMTFSTAPG
jgi:hypothetical protein